MQYNVIAMPGYSWVLVKKENPIAQIRALSICFFFVCFVFCTFYVGLTKNYL